jgi:hypothetical protein
MLAVQSYVEANTKEFKNTLAMAEYSVSLLKEHGLQTCLYTEETLVPFFKPLKYDRIVVIPKYFTSLVYPEFTLGMSQMYAATVINEPFIHVDFDCFILKREVIEELKNKEIFFLHEEFLGNDKYQTFIKRVMTDIPAFNVIDLDYDPLMHNTGLYGGTNFTLFKNVCKFVYYKFIQYQNYFKTLKCPSFFITQTIPFYMFKKLNVPVYKIVDAPDIETLYNNLTKKGIVHYWEAATHFKDMLYKTNFLNDTRLKTVITNLS